MSQRRFWNYKDDDLTWDLNRWRLGMDKEGLYVGFDAVLGATMNLTLNHAATGHAGIAQNLAVEPKAGMVVSTQGAVVRDDTVLSFPINPTGAGEYRVDVVYMEHEYVPTIGGTFATYGVVQGTASIGIFGITLPALPSPKKQVIIGYLILPPNTIALNQLNVKYIRKLADLSFSWQKIGPYNVNAAALMNVPLLTPNDGVTRRWEIEYSIRVQSVAGGASARSFNLYNITDSTPVLQTDMVYTAAGEVSKKLHIDLPPNKYISLQINEAGGPVTHVIANSLFKYKEIPTYPAM
jgi:hypothetical protein